MSFAAGDLELRSGCCLRQGPWIVKRYNLWSFLCVFKSYGYLKEGDTMRHKDDAWMDMAVRSSRFWRGGILPKDRRNGIDMRKVCADAAERENI